MWTTPNTHEGCIVKVRASHMFTTCGSASRVRRKGHKMRLLTCSICGKPFEKQHKEQTRCSNCQPTTDDRSLAEYKRARAIVLRNSPMCYWCLTNKATTADHLVPKAHGGTDDVSNLVPACGPCNYSRGDKAAPTILRRSTLPTTSRQSRSIRLT
jgi:hypothetical protein